VGVDPRDVVTVALSHLHNDHVGGLRHFAGRVPVHIQRKELDAARADPAEAEKNAMFRIDFDDPLIDWRLADGDVEIAPGVTALLTAGHTPGHQSFLVELDPTAGGGGYVFAFDAADLQENLDREEPVSAAFGGHPQTTLPAIRRLKAIAAERGFRLVPGHDPEVWPRFTRELGVAARP
jgi:glyoxylase-like metal-dependent hydrolase (beta-lactamase superfamily II)